MIAISAPNIMICERSWGPLPHPDHDAGQAQMPPVATKHASSSAPIAPSIVFPGLSQGANLCFPNNLPVKKAPMSPDLTVKTKSMTSPAPAGPGSETLLHCGVLLLGVTGATSAASSEKRQEAAPRAQLPQRPRLRYDEHSAAARIEPPVFEPHRAGSVLQHRRAGHD